MARFFFKHRWLTLLFSIHWWAGHGIVKQSLGVIHGHTGRDADWLVSETVMVRHCTTSAGRWWNQRTRERCSIGHPKAGSDATEMEWVLIKEEDELRAVIGGI